MDYVFDLLPILNISDFHFFPFVLLLSLPYFHSILSFFFSLVVHFLPIFSLSSFAFSFLFFFPFQTGWKHSAVLPATEHEFLPARPASLSGDRAAKKAWLAGEFSFAALLCRALLERASRQLQQKQRVPSASTPSLSLLYERDLILCVTVGQAVKAALIEKTAMTTTVLEERTSVENQRGFYNSDVTSRQPSEDSMGEEEEQKEREGEGASLGDAIALPPWLCRCLSDALCRLSRVVCSRGHCELARSLLVQACPLGEAAYGALSGRVADILIALGEEEAN